MRILGNKLIEIKLLALLSVCLISILALLGKIDVPGIEHATFGWWTFSIAAVALFSGILFALELPRGLAQHRRSIRAKYVWRVVFHSLRSWLLILFIILLILTGYLWWTTRSDPYSSLWDDVTTAKTPAGQSGSYLHSNATWILVDSGELWFYYDNFVFPKPVPPTSIPLGSTHYSPMGGFAEGTTFSQYYARKYWGVGSNSFGFSLRWSHGPYSGGRDGWGFSGAFPLWIAFLPAILLFAIRVRRITKLKQGHCPKCQYDLRAHAPGDKCPECGTAIPP